MKISNSLNLFTVKEYQGRADILNEARRSLAR